jgi:hypothetical protein
MIQSIKSFNLFFVLAVIATTAVPSHALAQAGRAENVVDGMLIPATPKLGKWTSTKMTNVATRGPDGFLREKEVSLGECPIEITAVTRIPLYKTDANGTVLDKDNKLISIGWVYQQETNSLTKKKEPRSFTRRTTKEGQPAFEPGGDVGQFSYQKDKMLGAYYTIAIKVDHFGIGRLQSLPPTMPMLLTPSKDERHLSRYDVGTDGRPKLKLYNVQEKMVGMQGESKVLEGGTEKGTGHGKPNEPFYKVQLDLDPESLEPVHLTYTAGIADNKDGDNWLFADTAEYMCKDFKKVD